VPELPEVETVAAGLRRTIVGRVIRGLRLYRPELLRDGRAADLRAFRNALVLDVHRRGKMLVITCAGDRALVFHLKMTGRFVWEASGVPRDRHTHLAIAFLGKRRELRFRDVRKFGFVRCFRPSRAESCPELVSLGPEPLGLELETFCRRLAERKGRLKSLLLNQSFMAGIGNIYADEMLFAARLHPERRASSLTVPERRRLWSAMQDILRRAVAAGGSTVRDFRTADGHDGRFQFEHNAYGRSGQPCPRCGTPIRRMVIGGRSSFFCPRCQRRTSRPRRWTVLN
jgi:formamidopyrimidine-DNA glycosylase